MREDQLFSAAAAVALLIWLVGRSRWIDGRRRRQVEAVAMGLLAAAMCYALIRAGLWFMA